MASSFRSTRTWIATALVCAVTTGVALVGGRGVTSVATAPGEPATAAEGGEPEARGAPEIADLNAAFRRRLTLFAPLEAGLRRALFGSGGDHERPSRPAGAFVRRESTAAGCLTQAVYYEARGEPAEGQAAVAQVVLNRARSGSHPGSVCGVVFEGASHAGCQFSFACDRRLGSRRPDPAAWGRAQAVAAAALAAPGRPELQDALNYHADYVRPGWAQRLRRAAEIGRHIFYAAKPPPAAQPLSE